MQEKADWHTQNVSSHPPDYYDHTLMRFLLGITWDTNIFTPCSFSLSTYTPFPDLLNTSCLIMFLPSSRPYSQMVRHCPSVGSAYLAISLQKRWTTRRTAPSSPTGTISLHYLQDYPWRVVIVLELSTFCTAEYRTICKTVPNKIFFFYHSTVDRGLPHDTLDESWEGGDIVVVIGMMGIWATRL